MLTYRRLILYFIVVLLAAALIFLAPLASNSKYLLDQTFLLHKHRPTRALCQNLAGQTLHEWELPDPNHFDRKVVASNSDIKFIGDRPPGRGQSLYHVELTTPGILYANFKFTSVVQVNSDSSYNWVSWGAYHHDLAVSSDGESIFTIKRRIEALPEYLNRTAKLDSIVELNKNGQVVKEIDLYSLLKPHMGAVWSRFKRGVSNPDPSLIHEDGADDIMHCNSIELISVPVKEIAAPGDFLISCAIPGILAIVDHKELKLRWVYQRPELRVQHDASQIPSGDILFLNNRFKKTGKRSELSSRVEIIDPRNNSIVWHFARPGWYTKNKGSVQLLPNGNFNITYSEIGLMAEVTREKEIVSLHTLQNPKQLKSEPEIVRVNRVKCNPLDF